MHNEDNIRSIETRLYESVDAYFLFDPFKYARLFTRRINWMKIHESHRNIFDNRFLLVFLFCWESYHGIPSEWNDLKSDNYVELQHCLICGSYQSYNVCQTIQNRLIAYFFSFHLSRFDGFNSSTKKYERNVIMQPISTIIKNSEFYGALHHNREYNIAKLASHYFSPTRFSRSNGIW